MFVFFDYGVGFMVNFINFGVSGCFGFLLIGDFYRGQGYDGYVIFVVGIQYWCLLCIIWYKIEVVGVIGGYDLVNFGKYCGLGVCIIGIF